MSDFDGELRAALAAQQRRLGPVGDAPTRLLHDGLHSPRRRYALQLTGALAALVAIATVVGVLMLTREHSRPAPAQPTSQPKPSQTWQSKLTTSYPLSAPLSVPDATPVILFRDPADRNQIDGVTWDGQTQGRVMVLDSMAGMLPNPQGTRFVSGSNVYDRAGNRIYQLSGLTKGGGPRWADDGQHLCGLSGTSLLLMSDGRTATVVTLPPLASDQVGISVAACSYRNDRAVVINTAPIGSTIQYWVVQLSTGRILSHRTLASQTFVVASLDASTIAEGANVYDFQGTLLRTLTAPVVGFSSDGSLAVTDGSEGAGVARSVNDRTVALTAPDQHVVTVYANPADGKMVAFAVNANGGAAGSNGYPDPASLEVGTATVSGVAAGVIVPQIRF